MQATLVTPPATAAAVPLAMRRVVMGAIVAAGAGGGLVEPGAGGLEWLIARAPEDYDTVMLPEHLRAVLRSYSRRRPFQPYHVELTSGSRILVEHPEAL